MPTEDGRCCGSYTESETEIFLRCLWCGATHKEDRNKFAPNYDHIGPLDGYCFMSLNFTPEQYAKINDIIASQLIGKDLDYGVEGAIVDLITASGPQPPKLDPVEVKSGLTAEQDLAIEQSELYRRRELLQSRGPSREWLLKMADAEDAAGSVSVGGLLGAWECTHCGSDILPGGECSHCGINDGDEKFKSELSHMMVRLILCLPMDHHLRDEATQWLLKRGLIVEGVAEAMKL